MAACGCVCLRVSVAASACVCVCLRVSARRDTSKPCELTNSVGDGIHFRRPIRLLTPRGTLILALCGMSSIIVIAGFLCILYRRL